MGKFMQCSMDMQRESSEAALPKRGAAACLPPLQPFRRTNLSKFFLLLNFSHTKHRKQNLSDPQLTTPSNANSRCKQRSTICGAGAVCQTQRLPQDTVCTNKRPPPHFPPAPSTISTSRPLRMGLLPARTYQQQLQNATDLSLPQSA